MVYPDGFVRAAIRFRQMKFYLQWIDGHPAIRVWSVEAKALPISLADAKNQIKTKMGPFYRGPYIPRGANGMTIALILKQEAERKTTPVQ